MSRARLFMVCVSCTVSPAMLEAQSPATCTGPAPRDASWSPDGGSVVFASDRTGQCELWSPDVRTGELRRLTRSGDYRLTDADGDQRRLTWTSPARDPALSESPDSLAVARTVADYVRGWREGNVPLLREVFAPQGVVMWTSDEGFHTMTFEEVLADRRPNPGYGEPWRIEHLRVVDGAVAVVEVFIARPERGIEFADILTLYRLDEGWRIVSKAYTSRSMSPAAAQDAVATRPSCQYQEPSWHPDGNEIVFTSNRTGEFELYSARLDGAGERQITEGGLGHGVPRWSPDGRRIAFVSDREGSGAIFIATPDLGDPWRLSPTGVTASAPAWSPDGERIAFVSVDAGRYGIWLMDRDGGGRRLLVDGCER